jgi:ankyrin repeat protein
LTTFSTFFAGNSVLHIAAQNGRDGVIKSLILNGADVNQGNNHKNVPLHLAAQNGFHKVAEVLLLAKKIDVDAKDLHFNTALHLAAQNGQLEVRRSGVIV